VCALAVRSTAVREARIGRRRRRKKKKMRTRERREEPRK
jgi:hypothetical protein